MRVFLKKSLSVAVLAASATSAMAASSIDLKVTGKIVPSSCTPAFGTGGGTADFGTIKVASLNSTTATSLPDIKSVPVTITCEEATRIAVKFSDNRHDSASTEAYSSFTGGLAGAVNQLFGLGTYGDKNIGNYILGIKKTPGAITNAAGDNLFPYSSSDGGENWGVNGIDYMVVVNDNSKIYSFGASGMDAKDKPEPQTLVNFTLGVSAMINPSNDLNVTDEATLDGLATIELVYL